MLKRARERLKHLKAQPPSDDTRKGISIETRMLAGLEDDIAALKLLAKLNRPSGLSDAEWSIVLHALFTARLDHEAHRLSANEAQAKLTAIKKLAAKLDKALQSYADLGYGLFVQDGDVLRPVSVDLRPLRECRAEMAGYLRASLGRERNGKTAFLRAVVFLLKQSRFEYSPSLVRFVADAAKRLSQLDPKPKYFTSDDVRKASLKQTQPKKPFSLTSARPHSRRKILYNFF